MTNLWQSLRSKLQYKAYEPKSEEEILREAENRYAKAYRQQALDARQAYEAADLAREQELESLQGRYQLQAEAAETAARQSAAEADRHALSRGMQRSSYNAQTLSNIRLAGDRAQGEIAQAQTDAENAIARERALATGQPGADAGANARKLRIGRGGVCGHPARARV